MLCAVCWVTGDEYGMSREARAGQVVGKEDVGRERGGTNRKLPWVTAASPQTPAAAAAAISGSTCTATPFKLNMRGRTYSWHAWAWTASTVAAAFIRVWHRCRRPAAAQTTRVGAAEIRVRHVAA